MNKGLRLFGLVLALLAALPAAAENFAAIKQRGVLRIGCEGTYSPFCYQDEQGNLVGFDVEVAKAFSLGGKPRLVEPSPRDAMPAPGARKIPAMSVRSGHGAAGRDAGGGG